MLDSLIQEGQAISQLPSNSPKRKLWSNRVEKYIAENYAEEYSQI